MSRFFPHEAYAEDQPLPRTILTVHVLTRGYTSGAVVGLGAVSAGSLYKRLLGTSSPSATAANKSGASLFSTTAAAAASSYSSSSTTSAAALLRILRTTGTASVVGLGLMGLALAGRMRAREDIEWRDRAWRLMANPGQLETDDWTYGGAAAGLAAVGLWARRGGLRANGAAVGIGGWRVFAGAAGLGSVAGTVGYLVWRYGVHRGKFSEDDLIGAA